MDSWSLGPPLLVGERIVFRNHGSYLPGTIKWLGMLKNYFGNQLVAGLALVSVSYQQSLKFELEMYANVTKHNPTEGRNLSMCYQHQGVHRDVVLGALIRNIGLTLDRPAR